MTLHKIAIVTMGLGMVFGAAAAPHYTLSDLGSPGGPLFGVVDINNAGQVAGSWKPAEFQWKGFLYTPGSGFKDIEPASWPPSREFGVDPRALNNLGEVVGDYRDRAYLYRPNGTGGFAPNVPAWPPSWFNASNDLGQAIGNSFVGVPFVYTPTQGTRAINVPNTYAHTAFDINNAGQVLLSRSERPDHPSLYLYDLATRALTTVVEDASGVNSGVLNDAGWVATSVNQGAGLHAMLYTGDAAIDLGALAGATFSSSVDINSLGQVLGVAYADATFTQRRGFLYTPGGGVTDLLSSIDTASKSGWTDLQFAGLNDRGQVVGSGLFDGALRGFVLNLAAPVPEPPLVFLMAAGLALLVTRFRHQA